MRKNNNFYYSRSVVNQMIFRKEELQTILYKITSYQPRNMS